MAYPTLNKLLLPDVKGTGHRPQQRTTPERGLETTAGRPCGAHALAPHFGDARAFGPGLCPLPHTHKIKLQAPM